MSRGDENYDVVVVGGGPGGATASTLLAKAGYRVALIERERFPRYQIGESLLPATIHGICKLLGVQEEIHSAGFVRKAGGTFRWGKNDEPWSFDFGTSGVNTDLDFAFAYQVERARFDAILLNNARRHGVRVFEESEAEELVIDGGRVAGAVVAGPGGKRILPSQWVVDASGNQSRFHRIAGERVFSRFFQNVAVFAYFEGAGRMPPPKSGNIFCCAFPQGWFWYIPLSDTLTSVGAVVDRQYAEALRSGPEEAMRGFIEMCPRIRQLLAPARRVTTGMYGTYRVRKDYSYCNTRFWKPGLALVGDAACFIDPVFSSGVHLATYSGMLAARSIATALKGTLPEDLCLNLFESSYRAEFSAFHDFLAGFYDMHKDEDAYFWKARKIIGGEESSSDAFLQLVAGAGTTVAEFTRLRSRTADVVEMQARIATGDANVDDMGRLVQQMDQKAAEFVIRNHQHRQDTVGRLFQEAHGERVNEAYRYRASADCLFWEAPPAPQFSGGYFVGRSLITPDQLSEGLNEQHTDQRPLGELLLARGHVSEESLAKALEAFHESQKEFRFTPYVLPDVYNRRAEIPVFLDIVEKRLRDKHAVPVKIETPVEFYGVPPVEQFAAECDYETMFEGSVYFGIASRLREAIGAQDAFLEGVVQMVLSTFWMRGKLFTSQPARSVDGNIPARPFLHALLWRINTPIGAALLLIGSR